MPGAGAGVSEGSASSPAAGSATEESADHRTTAGRCAGDCTTKPKLGSPKQNTTATELVRGIAASTARTPALPRQGVPPNAYGGDNNAYDRASGVESERVASAIQPRALKAGLLRQRGRQRASKHVKARRNTPHSTVSMRGCSEPPARGIPWGSNHIDSDRIHVRCLPAADTCQRLRYVNQAMCNRARACRSPAGRCGRRRTCPG